jgi:hypothetical protein
MATVSGKGRELSEDQSVGRLSCGEVVPLMTRRGNKLGNEDALGRLRHGNEEPVWGRAGVLSGFVGGRSGLMSSVGEGRVAMGKRGSCGRALVALLVLWVFAT